MNKQKSIEEAIAEIQSGSVIMVGGFGSPGTPFTLIDELLAQGQNNLTIIKNDANEQCLGISKLIENQRVKKLVTTHIGLNKYVVDLKNSGELIVNFHPQGILAEKIRVAGSGCFGFLSDIGIETEITEDNQLVEWKGRTLKIEEPLNADFALLHAHQADHYGNLRYQGSAMNFSPLMAMAADNVIVETPNLLLPGDIEPDSVHTPSAFVSSVIALQKLSSEYGLMEGRFENQ